MSIRTGSIETYRRGAEKRRDSQRALRASALSAALRLCGEGTRLIAIQEKLLPRFREFAERILPLPYPLVEVAAVFDDLAVAGAAGEQVDGQPVGDEFVRLAPPVELLGVHVPRDLHAP